MVASVGLRGTPRKEPIFIPQNGPLSGARRTFEKRKRMTFRNQILEFVRGKNFPNRREVNFEVAPKDTTKTYPKIKNGAKKVNHQLKKKNKTKSNNDVDTISMPKLDKIIRELISKQIKLHDMKVKSEQEIKKIRKQLEHGIRITQLQQLLHHKLRRHLVSRLPYTGF